jgi:HEAT repeat protein
VRSSLRYAALIALVAISASAEADTVRLRSGDVLEGTVADHGDRIQVVTEDGPLSVRWRDVDVVLTEATAKDLYAERRAKLAGDDVQGLYELALWAARSRLREESRACLDAVLKADPEHAAARSALAQQKVGDEWLAGSKLLEAKGFVSHGGKWLLREEAEYRKRRAESPGEMSGDEKRVADLIAKAASERPGARKFAMEALAGMSPDAIGRPALRALRRGTPEERVVAAELLGRWGDVDAVRPLIYATIMDREAPVRRAGVRALQQIDDEDAIRPLARALFSETPLIATRAAEALGAFGGRQAVEWVVRRVQSGGGPGGRNNIFVGRQISYISDFDVEIAQAAQIGDPIVGTIREGVILDTRVLGVREEFTTIERRAFYQALRDATGKDFGEDAAAWKKWYDEEGAEALAAK